MEVGRIFQSIQIITRQEVDDAGVVNIVTDRINTDIQIDLKKVTAFQHYVNPDTGNIDGSITQVNVEGALDIKLIKIPFTIFKQFIDALV